MEIMRKTSEKAVWHNTELTEEKKMPCLSNLNQSEIQNIFLKCSVVFKSRLRNDRRSINSRMLQAILQKFFLK